MKNARGVLAICILAFVTTSSAQFIRFSVEKTVPISIPRPPDFGLTVRRVAFGQASGQCASELVDRMVLPDFQGNHIDVIERQNLDQIMAEHNFNRTAYADPTQAAELGKILGPSALVMVSVDACSPQQDSLYNDQKNFDGSVHRILISKTRFTLEGSIRVVDLTTGRVLGSHNFQSKPEKQNTAENGQPEFPPVDEVKDEAMQLVRTQIHNMFFPGFEMARLPFYDDKDCGLKETYELLHRGDREGALKLSETNVQQCEGGHKKDKSLARAYYNAGLMNCILGNFDKSKEFLSHAMETKGADAIAQASADCSRAQSGAAGVKAYRERVAQIPEPTTIVTRPSGGNIPDVSRAQDSKPAATQSGNAPQTQTAVANLSKSPDITDPTKPSVEERLKKLDGLLKKGLITRKDYDAKKAEILKDL